MANAILAAALSVIEPAVDKLLGEGEAAVPALTDEALNFFENTVAPKLDVPSVVVDIVKTQNATVEAVTDPFLVAELKLLQARADSILNSVL